MVQILDRPSFGGRLGSALGTGLADRFKALEDQKKLQAQRGDTMQALEALGYEPSIAERLSKLDPQTLRSVVTENIKMKQLEQQQQFKQQGLQQQASQKQQSDLQSAQQSDEELKAAMQAAGIPDDAIDFVFPLVKQVPKDKRAEFIQTFAEKAAEDADLPEHEQKQFDEILAMEDDIGVEDIANADFSGIAEAGPLTLDKFNEMFIRDLKGLKPKNISATDVAQGEAPLPPTEPEQVAPMQQAALVEKPKKASVAEILRRPSQSEKDKSLEKYSYYLQPLNEKANAAVKEMEEVKKLQKLNESGKLDTQSTMAFLNGLGMDPTILLNPESQEFEKISQGFLKNAKRYFGSKVTEGEIKQYMKTIPTLLQSPEGRSRIVANMKDMLRAAILEQEIAYDIIKKNGGKAPDDLVGKVNRRYKDDRKKLYAKFEKDIKRKVPEGESGANVAISGLGGSALGGIAKLAPTVAKTAAGAGVGFLLGGPLGAAAGGALGGGSSFFS